MAGEPPVFSPAIRIDVVVHRAEGVAPGAYRYEPGRRGLRPTRPPGDLRHAASAAALDQDVIGEAAVVFVLSMDRDAFAADPLGPARGYRHAFLEAGLVGERIYLEAGARGLGVCAVGAFYDDEATTLVGIDPAREWIVHFAGLGVPA
jgi:SagB-type dehydrogenase family enzyme